MADQTTQAPPPAPNAATIDSSSRTVTAISVPDLHTPNILHQAHHYVSIKLTATNYLFWRAQLVPFLRGQNLYGFVDGSNACPPEFVTPANSATPVANPLRA